jgi:hypothetical protein
MLHVLQQARNAAKQRSIGGLALASPAVLLLLLRAGGVLRCKCCAADFLFAGGCATNRLVAWLPSKSKGAHDGTYARD